MGQKYITTLTTSCLEAILDQVEVANITRIKKREKLLYVELKDENGQRHYAQVTWKPLRDASEGTAFAIFNVKISDQRWRVRLHYHNQPEIDSCMAVAMPVHPCGQQGRSSQSFWFEGRPIDAKSSIETCKCTCCETRHHSVKQAYWGGSAVKGIALCSKCQQHPVVTFFNGTALSC